MSFDRLPSNVASGEWTGRVAYVFVFGHGQANNQSSARSSSLSSCAPSIIDRCTSLGLAQHRDVLSKSVYVHDTLSDGRARSLPPRPGTARAGA